MNKRYSPAELADMTMRQMETHAKAEKLNIKFHKSKTKAAVAKEILAAYGARDIDAAKAGVAEQRPVNPEFENLVTPGSVLDENENLPANEPTMQVDNRGGARPGAGRPLGMTAERARMTHLSDCPHPAVLGLLEILFEGWAVKVGCPAVALTKEEAFDLALPWTNVLEYAGVAQRIPVWAELAITCTWNTVNILKTKAGIARQYAADHKRPDATAVAATDAKAVDNG